MTSSAQAMAAILYESQILLHSTWGSISFCCAAQTRDSIFQVIDPTTREAGRIGSLSLGGESICIGAPRVWEVEVCIVKLGNQKKTTWLGVSLIILLVLVVIQTTKGCSASSSSASVLPAPASPPAVLTSPCCNCALWVTADEQRKPRGAFYQQPSGITLHLPQNPKCQPPQWTRVCWARTGAEASRCLRRSKVSQAETWKAS